MCPVSKNPSSLWFLIFGAYGGFGNCTDAYFRRTGLERCESLERDLEWFRTTQDLAIPEPSQVGVSYAKYLEEEAKENAALFLSHFYSIYFSHIAGGQVIVRRVSFFNRII